MTDKSTVKSMRPSSDCIRQTGCLNSVWTQTRRFTIPDSWRQLIVVRVTVGDADDMGKLIKNRSRGITQAIGLCLCFVLFQGCASFQESGNNSSYSRNKTTGWERCKKSSKKAWSKTLEVLDPYPDNPSPPPKWLPQPETKKPESVQDFLGQPRVGT
ncbi:MAG: hypothetical protein ACK5N9_15005 [Pirellula sp.]